MADSGEQALATIPSEVADSAVQEPAMLPLEAVADIPDQAGSTTELWRLGSAAPT